MPGKKTAPKNKISVKRKKQIPKAVRVAVWNKYIGNNIAQSECSVGCGEMISINNFECGHVISEKHGGPITIQNLRPICSNCNKSMGTTNMQEFINTYGFNEAIGDKISKNDVNDDPFRRYNAFRESNPLGLMSFPTNPYLKELCGSFILDNKY